MLLSLEGTQYSFVASPVSPNWLTFELTLPCVCVSFSCKFSRSRLVVAVSVASEALSQVAVKSERSVT